MCRDEFGRLIIYPARGDGCPATVGLTARSTFWRSSSEPCKSTHNQFQPRFQRTGVQNNYPDCVFFLLSLITLCVFCKTILCQVEA